MNIASCEECMKHMGRYPVLLLDLKFFEAGNAEAFRDELYHKYYKAVLESAEPRCADVIPQIKKLWGKRCNSHLAGSIKPMMELVQKSINKNFIVLIDEYDHRQHAFEHGFIDDAERIMNSFYITLLKGNSHLMLAFCIGILPIAKSSMLSGFNNANLTTVLTTDAKYRVSFGFTKDEVAKLCEGSKTLDISPELQFAANIQLDDARSSMEIMELCFNGYMIGGDTTIFNTWSIVNSIGQETISSWWIESGTSDMIHEILWYNVDQIVIEDRRKLLLIASETFWSFLVHAGYLTAQGPPLEPTDADLRIPNYEIRRVWSRWLQTPFRYNKSLDGPDTLMERLHNGDRKGFSVLLQKYLEDLSCFDIAKHREDVYHVWMMGISVELKRRDWKVHSNYKSSHGRLDMSLQLANDPKALVFESQNLCADENKEKIFAKVQEGFQQIADNGYCYKFDDYVTSAETVSICFHNREAEFKFGTAIRQGDIWKYDV